MQVLGGCRRGNGQAQLLGRGIEEAAQQLRIGSTGLGQSMLPTADQAGADPKLPLVKLDAEAHKLPDQVVLGPTPELALRPQLPILHNTLPQRTNPSDDPNSGPVNGRKGHMRKASKR